MVAFPNTVNKPLAYVSGHTYNPLRCVGFHQHVTSDEKESRLRAGPHATISARNQFQ